MNSWQFHTARANLLMGLFPTRSSKFAAMLMRLPSLRDDRGPILLMELSTTQSPTKFVAPLMGLRPLGDDRRPTLQMGLSPTQSSAKFAALLLGLPPFVDDCGHTSLLGLCPTQSPRFVSRPVSQNTRKRSRDEGRRRIYARKIPHAYTLSLK